MKLRDDQIDVAAALLLEGELVAFPTETVYGLGALASSPEAIQKIYLAKGRPSDNPLIVHISDLEQISRLAIDIPPIATSLFEAFFPGPLTLILNRHPLVPNSVSGGLETVAIRMPAHPVARELIREVGEPLVAPSANLSGRPSPTTAQHVLDDLEGKIAAVVDGGVCSVGIESTVLSLIDAVPRLLRPGAISRPELERVLRCEVVVGGEARNLSPGMKYRHYAPAVPLELVFTEEELQARLGILKDQRVLVLKDELTSATLYAQLRSGEKFDRIIAYCNSRVMADPALMNRLTKAAGWANLSSGLPDQRELDFVQ